MRGCLVAPTRVIGICWHVTPLLHFFPKVPRDDQVIGGRRVLCSATFASSGLGKRLPLVFL